MGLIGALKPRPRRDAARRGELALAAALLSAGAAAIHAAVIGPHIREYVAYGVLFAASALAQAAWTALILAAPSARLLVAGAVGNAGIVAAWALSRTVGLPLGPEPWTPEPVGALDVAATAFEVAIVGASGTLLAAGGPYNPACARHFARLAATGAAAIAGVTGAAFAATGDGVAHHHAADQTHQSAPGHVHTAAGRTGPAPADAAASSRRANGERGAKPQRRSRPHAHAHVHAVPHVHTGG